MQRSHSDVQPLWGIEALTPVRNTLINLATQICVKPRSETAVKCTGSLVAAAFAFKYAGSLRSACMFGVLSGVFAHSLYADIIANKSLNSEAPDLDQIEHDVVVEDKGFNGKTDKIIISDLLN